MPDVHVDHGTTAKLGRVEGTLTAGRSVRIESEFGGRVVVTGTAHFQGNAEIACDFECDALTVDRGRIRVAGNLTVHKDLDVAHTAEVDGNVRAHDIDVGGKIFAKTISCDGSIRVGGLMHVSETLEAESVEVAGRAEVSGKVKILDFAVGGKADVGGGTITGKTRIGGVFTSTLPLQFGELQVYGKCELPGDCRGEKISTFGKLSVNGTINCDQVDVGGTAYLRGNLIAGEVLVNGKLNITGSLSMKGTLETNGSCEIGGELTGTDLRVGGGFKSDKALLTNSADIAGEVETKRGLKGGSIMIRSGTRCRSALVGGRVELGKSGFAIVDFSSHWAGQRIAMRGIGRMTSADDIYGTEVVLGPHSKCGNVFASRVELNDGCIASKVTYTDELRRGGARVFLAQPSAKVTQLPPFPL